MLGSSGSSESSDAEGWASSSKRRTCSSIRRSRSSCSPHAVTTHAKRTMRAGEGRVSVDYARVAEIMRRCNYAGYISVEYEDEEDPRTAVPAFVEYLKQCVR